MPKGKGVSHKHPTMHNPNHTGNSAPVSESYSQQQAIADKAISKCLSTKAGRR